MCAGLTGLKSNLVEVLILCHACTWLVTLPCSLPNFWTSHNSSIIKAWIQKTWRTVELKLLNHNQCILHSINCWSFDSTIHAFNITVVELSPYTITYIWSSFENVFTDSSFDTMHFWTKRTVKPSHEILAAFISNLLTQEGPADSFRSCRSWWAPCSNISTPMAVQRYTKDSKTDHAPKMQFCLSMFILCSIGTLWGWLCVLPALLN